MGSRRLGGSLRFAGFDSSRLSMSTKADRLARARKNLADPNAALAEGTGRISLSDPGAASASTAVDPVLTPRLQGKLMEAARNSVAEKSGSDDDDDDDDDDEEDEEDADGEDDERPTTLAGKVTAKFTSIKESLFGDRHVVAPQSAGVSGPPKLPGGTSFFYDESTKELQTWATKYNLHSEAVELLQEAGIETLHDLQHLQGSEAEMCVPPSPPSLEPSRVLSPRLPRAGSAASSTTRRCCVARCGRP